MIVFLWGISISLTALPKNVILIRHAEKTPHHYSLNLKGFERAVALPYYFLYTPLYNNPPISHIFAAGLKGADPLARTVQTCAPTASIYKLPINTDYNHKDTQEIAQEILTNPQYNNSTVLICWTHGYAGDLIQALGGNDPGFWSNDVFDQVYMLSFNKGNSPHFEKILQKLMFGDRQSFGKE